MVRHSKTKRNIKIKEIRYHQIRFLNNVLWILLAALFRDKTKRIIGNQEIIHHRSQISLLTNVLWILLIALHDKTKKTGKQKIYNRKISRLNSHWTPPALAAMSHSSKPKGKGQECRNQRISLLLNSLPRSPLVAALLLIKI
jgi:hypothetical protein